MVGEKLSMILSSFNGDTITGYCGVVGGVAPEILSAIIAEGKKKKYICVTVQTSESETADQSDWFYLKGFRFNTTSVSVRFVCLLSNAD